MEFLNINGSKLKVVISESECRTLGIEASSDDLAGPRIRSIVRNILATAEEKCDFLSGGDRILVQIFPLPDGQCELLVSRLGMIPKRERDMLSSARGVSVFESRQGVYRFASFDDLRAAAHVISARPRADLYLGADGAYYISLDEDVTDGISELEILIEYGERLHRLPLDVVSEYGAKLAESNAFDYIINELSE